HRPHGRPAALRVPAGPGQGEVTGQDRRGAGEAHRLILCRCSPSASRGGSRWSGSRPSAPAGTVSRMGIRAVVWDVDDTLFDYTTADREGLRAHLRAEGLLARYGSAEEALTLWREITDAQWARFAAGEVDFVTQRRDRTRVFLGRELTDQEADDWFGRYLVHYEAAWSLFPDV